MKPLGHHKCMTRLPILCSALCAALTCLATAQVPQWSLVPELRYPESADGPLTEIMRLVASPACHIYVVDINIKAVLVFDVSGEHRHTIGRRGGGPGEFQRLYGIGWLSDTLWVVDDASNRISLFDQEGSLHEVRKMPQVSSGPTGMPLRAKALLADGSYLMLPSYSYSELAEREDEGIPLVRVVPTAETVDTVRSLVAKNYSLMLDIPNGMLQANQPWSTKDLLAVSRAGDRAIVVERPQPIDSDSGEYRVIALDAAGQMIYERRIPWTPVPLTDSMVAEWITWYLEVTALEERFPSRAAAHRALEKSLYRPDYLPAVPRGARGLFRGSVVVGSDETVWIRRELGEADAQHWDVLDANGELIANASAPKGLLMYDVSADYAWGAIKDSMDVPVIVRLRISRSDL